MISFSQNIIGLDIGLSSVKLVEAQVTPRAVKVLHAAIGEYPVMDTGLKPEVVTSTLKTLIRQERIKGRNAIATIGGESVFIKYLYLPPTPEKELAEMVKWEIERSGLFSSKDSAYDFDIQREFIDDKGNVKTEILVGAVKKSILNNYLQIIQKAGLRPVGITIKPLAYLNLLKMSNPAGAGPKTDETIALIDLGKIYSSLVIMREGRSILFREMTVGANEITNEISEILNISWETAEKLKQGIGFTGESPAERLREELPRELLAELSSQGGIKEISNAMRPVLEKLLSEIERTIGYFHRQFPQESLKYLYITGGGGQLRNIETFLSEGFHLPVKRLEIFGGDFMIKPSSETVTDNVEGNRLALAIGLTERRSLHQINLLPPSARRFKEYLISYIKGKGLLYISLPFLVPLLILIAFGLDQWINYARQRKTDLDNEIDQYKSYDLPNFQALVKEVEQMQNEVAVLEGTRRQEIPWEAVFRELSRLTPAKKVWLTALNFEAKPVQTPQPPAGTANPPAVKPDVLYLLELVGYAISQEEVGNFVEALSRSPYFQKVEPPSIQKTQLTTPPLGEVISFKINVQLSPDNNR